MSADAADSSVDMDRLNRNMPEYGRQTRQVLQVSVCVLFRGGRGSGGDGERKKKGMSQRKERQPEASLFRTWQHIAEKYCQIFPFYQFSSVDRFFHTHRERSHPVTTGPIDVKCQHIDWVFSTRMLHG